VVPTHEAQALLAYLLSLKQTAFHGDTGEKSGAMREMATSGATSADNGRDAAKGEALFTANCAACHQATGKGLPGAFPPLQGNAVVNDADATMHIRVVLHGLQGANVGGAVYSSPMPPFADTLGDEDIASIINYERGAWGNHGAPVTAGQVAAQRAKGK
jgi:cytochrome c oxidase cbb3-type subunit 2